MFRLFSFFLWAAAVAVLGLVTHITVNHAEAETCTRVGNTTYCTGSGGNTTCTRVGNTTYCN